MVKETEEKGTKFRNSQSKSDANSIVHCLSSIQNKNYFKITFYLINLKMNSTMQKQIISSHLRITFQCSLQHYNGEKF